MSQYPTAYWDESSACWKTDLRSRRFGSFDRVVLADVPRVNTQEAHLLAAASAVMKWRELVADAERSSAQLRLDLSGTLTLGVVAAEYLAKREAKEKPSEHSRKRGGWKYVASYHRSVTRELGHVHLAAFVPPGGNNLLTDYRDDCAARGLGPKARANRMGVIHQVLRFCFNGGRLAALPVMPEPTIGDETLSNPEFRWYTEDDFRTLRDRFYEHVGPGHGLWRWLRGDRARVADYIARRKLYLSTGFYTGMHTYNLDVLDDLSFRPRHGTFLRRNQKSAHCVLEAVKQMPEALWEDTIAEVNRLGRPWRKGELVAGGRWNTVTRELASEAERLNLPVATPTIFRHSVAYHLCLLGWSESATADYLGHIDDRMVRTVYNQVVAEDRWRGGEALPWTNESMRKVRGGVTRRAVVFDFETSRPGTTPPPARALQSIKNNAGDAGGKPR